MTIPVNHRRRRPCFGAGCEPNEAFTLLSLCCCTGAVTAACFGVSAITERLSLKDPGLFWMCTTGSFPTILILIFLSTAFLLGSSFYGYLILPLLSAGFGFFVYCSAALALSGISLSASLPLLLSFALPMLIVIPCFFVAAADAYLASRQLKTIVIRRFLPDSRRQALHFVLCVPILALAALIAFFFGGS